MSALETIGFDPFECKCRQCSWLDTNLGCVLDKKCDLHQKIEDLQSDMQITEQVSRSSTSVLNSVCEAIRSYDDDNPIEVAKERMEEISSLEDESATLAARVAELETEIKALHGDRAELILALQPLLGCADYAREQDLSGHELLAISASDAYEANSIHERVLNRAAKAGGGNV